MLGGLPLAIKVFGSNLLNQPEADWRWFINKLKRVPIEDVENKLIISFQALKSVDPMLQNIYLDIACFFVGCKKKEVVNIMETCYTFVNRHIDILNKRCLLTTNDEDELEMHDLLQDMGRNIARNESPVEPEKHSRLWVSKDICDVLKKKKGTEAVECIIPRDNNQGALEGLSFTTKPFESMSKLRFLLLEKVNIIGSFEQIFEDLRLLCWKYYPLRCLPSEFYPPKLVILALPGSKLRTMWEPNMVSHVFGKLKTLNMSDSRDLVATPDFIRLPSLETLNLEWCESLEEVHISIGSLERLGSLNLEGCKKLRSLPDTICDLRALKVLNISRCNSLEALPLQLGNIKSLTKLNADELSVSKLPESIGDLNKLVKLDLSNNKKLETLPNTICNLRALEVLRINGCSNVKALPVKLGNIESLKKLSAWYLSVSKLPDSIGSLAKLVELDLWGNEKLETLPDTIGNLRSLETLDISNCIKLQALPDELWKIANDAKHLRYIPKFPPNLKWIDASSCKSLERLPNLSNLKQLEDLISIRELDFRGCSGLSHRNLPKRLFKVYSEFGRQINVHVPQFMDQKTDPQWLDWIIESPYWTSESSDSKSLRSLPDTICNLRTLEVLDICDCSCLETLPTALGNIQSLRELNAGNLTVSILPDSTGHLNKLVKLRLNRNNNLKTLPVTICNLRSLEILDISRCEKLEILLDQLCRLQV